MKKTLFYILIFFAAFFANGKMFAQTGEHFVPLTSNPDQMEDAGRMAAMRSGGVSAQDTIVLTSLGLHEDFSYDSHRPDSSIWDIGFTNPPSGVYINRTWAIAPINLGVCTFDGINWLGEPYVPLAQSNSTGRCDDLVSKAIDLSGFTVADSVYLSFWYEPQGRGYAPNAQDSFLLDFNIPSWNDTLTATTIWKNIWYKEGYAPSSVDTNFHLVLIKLDSASYFTNGFRFRFHNYASQCGSNDHWHLDEIVLKNNRTIHDTLPGDVAFVYPPSSALKDYWAVPHTHYKPTMMASNFNVQLRNNDNAPRNITYWYYAYDQTNSLISGTPYPNAVGAPDGAMPTYWSSGYENFPTVTNPPVTFSFNQPMVLNDSMAFQVKHVLKESLLKIDTCTNLQKFYNYYAYDDGSAEVGYGLYGQYSQLAYKFTMSDVMPNDTLRAIQMYFLPVMDITNLEQRTFTLKVWADGGNQPGTLLYSERTQSPEYSFETPDRFITYKLDSGYVHLVGGQTYYIGWEQQAIDRLYIGFDFNTDHHDKIYYNTTGNWNTSQFNGSLMMRPVFGTVYPTGEDFSGVQEHNPSASFTIYPNPAHDRITIAGLKGTNNKVSLMDISGREIVSNQEISSDGTLDVSMLSSGMYFVQLKNEKGELLGTQRLIISE
jgi:hypothetical protein